MCCCPAEVGKCVGLLSPSLSLWGTFLQTASALADFSRKVSAWDAAVTSVKWALWMLLENAFPGLLVLGFLLSFSFFCPDSVSPGVRKDVGKHVVEFSWGEKSRS